MALYWNTRSLNSRATLRAMNEISLSISLPPSSLAPAVRLNLDFALVDVRDSRLSRTLPMRNRRYLPRAYVTGTETRNFKSYPRMCDT
jgi:hypothetical protein